MCPPEGAAPHRKSSGGAYQAGFLIVMSYETVVAIVVCNAAATLLIFLGMLSMGFTKANRPVRLPKKAAKLLWRSDPIVPKHDPPYFDVGQFKGMHARADMEFFTDFKEFAELMNWWLANIGKYVASRFRLQDLPDDRVDSQWWNDQKGHWERSGATRGRRFRLYYNQYPVGLLQVYHDLGYTTGTPNVSTDVKIDRAQNFSYNELMIFLDAIAEHLVKRDQKSDERIAARRNIEAALMQTLWGTDEANRGRYDRPDFQESLRPLFVRLKGSAELYVSHAISRREQGQAAPSRRPLS
jgi:hypothetical protein